MPNRSHYFVNRVLMLLMIIAMVAVGLISVTEGLAQAPDDALEQGFRNPPESARPRTWWHWTASNVTTAGITKDLEWMKRVGIAGFQLADVNAGGGQTVDQKVVFGTPEWLAAVRHAAAEAEGEFLAAVAASSVYRLLGRQGLSSETMPVVGEPLLGTLSYYEHKGGHGTIPSDWELFVRFLKMNL